MIALVAMLGRPLDVPDGLLMAAVIPEAACARSKALHAGS
jgi:hypothetical protein